MPDPDDDTDAGGEAEDDRHRNKADHGAEAEEAHKKQHHTGEDGGNLQAVEAVLRGDASEDSDEGAGRPGNLYARAAADRNDETGNDGGIDALFRFDACCDGKGHGKRQGDNADDDAGDDVA